VKQFVLVVQRKLEGREMTTGRETGRGEKGAKVVYQERCSSRGSARIKPGGVGETVPLALRSSGSVLHYPKLPKHITLF
jgi:hypothetical protein